MKRFSKALLAAAALTTAIAPVVAKAADVRPSDARVAVSSAAIAAPEAVRADAALDPSQQSDIVGVPLAVLIAAIIAALITLGIIIDHNKSP